MSVNRHPIEPEELMSYLDGELSTDRASAAVSHLDRCPECRSLATDFRNISQRMMAWEIEAPDSQIPAVMVAALEQRTKNAHAVWLKPPVSKSRVFLRRWVLAGAFVAACLVVGLGIERTTLSRSRSVAQSKQRAVTTLLANPGPIADSNGLLGGHEDTVMSFAQSPAAQHAEPVDGQPGADKQSNVAIAVGPMIVRTAGLTVTTTDFDKARAGLDDILRRHRGYVGDLTLNTPSGAGRSFTATLRVPADQLDATIADLRKLGRIDSETQSGQEVTAQYVDLEARLANARNTERRLTDLLSQRTGKLSDVLAVENEVDRVRGEIERMEAEKKNLANRVAFATVNATVAEDYKAQLQVVPVSTSGRIHNAAVEGYRSMVESVIGLALFFFSFGPSLLLWAAILFFPARFAWKKGRQFFAE